MRECTCGSRATSVTQKLQISLRVFPILTTTTFYYDTALTSPYKTTNDGYYSTLFCGNGDVYAISTNTTTGLLITSILCTSVAAPTETPTPTPTSTSTPTPTPTPTY